MGGRVACRNAILIIAVIVLSFTSCRNKDTSVSDKDGILGIEVPVGSGKVKDDAPYVVVGVYENSPAYSAGIRPDDIIMQIDGVDLKGLEYDYIYRNLLQGKAGTKVTFLLKRKNQSLIIDAVRARKARS